MSLKKVLAISKPGKYFFSLGICLLFSISFAFSQDTLDYKEDYYSDYNEDLIAPANDTLTVEARSVDKTKLDELKKDAAFDYTQAPTVGENLWDRFWAWVGQFIQDILRGAVNTSWSQVLIWVGSLIVIIIIVFALLKVDAFKVLFKGADAPSVKGIFYENIHAMDFESLIKEATEKGDLRNAVRLIFLYSLKLLSDGQHISWQPGKTNHDYLQEIKINELKPGLSELSFYFDYTWYGGFPISHAQFNKVNSIFKDWRTAIR